MYSEDVMSRPTVSCWRQSFIERRTTLHGEQQSGHPSTSRNTNVVKDVRVIELDRRLTKSFLSCHLTLKSVVIFVYLKSEQKMGSLPALGIAQRTKSWYCITISTFCGWWVVTGDETWVHHWMLECKTQSMVLEGKEQSSDKKSSSCESAEKVMTTVFRDSKGVLLIEYLLHRIMVTAACYCERY